MKQNLNKYIEVVKGYIKAHDRDIKTATPIIIVMGGLIGIVAYAALHNSGPNIVYQPAKACSLLTPSEAQDLLGDKVNSTEKNEPVIQENLATSRCSYTDLPASEDQIRVAAVAVRSGINDAGVEKNKADFALSQMNNEVEVVKGFGKEAYFNNTSRQLNILTDHDWIILNYGIGSARELNTLEDAIKLAKIVLK